MKVVLTALNAKYVHTCLSVRYLKRYAERECGTDTLFEIYESTINNRSEIIQKELYLKCPDIIAFSCYIWNIEMVLKLCCLLKKTLPHLIIILGGPEVSYSPGEILNEHDAVDFVFSGEGELPFTKLVQCLVESCDYSGISGLSCRDSGRIIINPPSEPVDMGMLPFAYQNELDKLNGRILYYEASRGCPFRCSYCLSSSGKGGVRFAPIEKVKKELKEILLNNVMQVKLVDRTFNCNKDFAAEIIRFLIKNDNGITNFHFEIEALNLDDTLIKILTSARAGLFQLEIGVQSVNDNTLSAVGRRSGFEGIKTAVEKLKANRNIHIHLDLIAGLPLEDFISFRKSFNSVFSLRPHHLQLGFLKLLKGSGIRNEADKYEMDYSPFAPYEILKTSCLSYDDVLNLKAVEEVTELYYNSGRFKHSVEFLLGLPSVKYETPFDFFLGLAEYADESAIIENGAESKLFPYKKLLDFADAEYGYNKFLHYMARYDMLKHEKLSYAPPWLDIDFDMSFSEHTVKRLRENGTVKNLVPEYANLQSRQLSKHLHAEKFPFNPLTNKEGETVILFIYHRDNGRRSTEVFAV